MSTIEQLKEEEKKLLGEREGLEYEMSAINMKLGLLAKQIYSKTHNGKLMPVLDKKSIKQKTTAKMVKSITGRLRV